MLGVVEDLVESPGLDDPPPVHDQDPVGDLGHDAEVVGDQYHRQAPLGVQRLQEPQDLRLDRHVERGRRLVGDQQVGLQGEPHRDHRPLAHPTRELVRERVHALLGSGDPDRLQQLDRPVPTPPPC